MCCLVLGSLRLESALQIFLTSTEQRERSASFDLLERSGCSEHLWCEGTLLAHGQLAYQDSQVPLGLPPILVPGVPPQEQVFALPLSCISYLLLFSQSVKVPLNSSTTLWCIDYFWFCTVAIIDEGIEQYWLSYQLLGCVFDDWLTAGLCASGPQCLEFNTGQFSLLITLGFRWKTWFTLAVGVNKDF